MELNHDNFHKSLEGIKASEEFLAKTKTLMKEAAAMPAPRRFPKIAMISGTAAAACIAIIAVFSFGGSDDIASDTSASEATSVCETYAPQKTTGAALDDEALGAGANAIFDDEEALPEENEPNEEEDSNTNEAAALTQSAETPAEETQKTKETTATAAETSEKAEDISEEDDEDIAPALGNYSADAGNSSEEEPTNDESDDIIEDGADAGYMDDEEIFDDDYLENPSAGEGGIDTEDDSSSKAVEPSFTSVTGGNAYSYESFSPSDTKKLREFLALASGDEINAEVTINDISSDIFSVTAQDLNSELLGLIGGFTLCEDDILDISVSFSVYDNRNGYLLYTVGIGEGGVLSVSIKGGEAVYFNSGGTEELLAIIL